ncbi:SAM-dependent methyltransferase [Yoonia sp. 2307UL14-13]|uniref:SAM-dependent methyltransferase n=1 Tax=Yoonia sp. 2307UL14-13 TaxID=3126506 RepID=UPI0030A1D5E3
MRLGVCACSIQFEQTCTNCHHIAGLPANEIAGFLSAAKAAGIPVEIVPGVTAAFVAAATLGRSLTERGQTDTIVLATGTGRPEAPLPDCTRFAGPGTALHMAACHAPRIAEALLERGLPPHTQIEIAVDISKPTERLIETRLDALAQTVDSNAIDGCAILLITWPFAAQQQIVSAA